MPVTDALVEEVLSLVSAGQKIAAIKRYRVMTGVGLAEAKDAVERLAKGDRVRESRKGAEEAALPAIREGDTIEAIRRYRVHSTAGLKEAKDEVEALTLVHQSNGRLSSQIAREVIDMMARGRKHDPVTHLVSRAGYEEEDAKMLIGTIRKSSATSTFSLVASFGLLIVTAIALAQGRCGL